MKTPEEMWKDRESRKSSIGDGIAWAGFWIGLAIVLSTYEIAKVL